MIDLPLDRSLTDPEIAVAVAEAILNDRQNPGMDLPFQPHGNGLLARLGVREGGDRAHQEWRQRFSDVNPDLDRRLAEYCWRLVGLGFFVPQVNSTWGSFYPTEKGRAYLEGLDPTAITVGGLDAKLAELGLSHADLPRLYGRLAQDCFLAGHYESSVVMLGVASEALIESVAAALENVQARVIPTNRARPANATARQDLTWIADSLSTHRNDIRRALTAAGADDAWLEPLRDQIAGAGQAIRLTRNDYGHPTGFTAGQDEALPLLTIFPRFAGDCVRGVAALSRL